VGHGAVPAAPLPAWSYPYEVAAQSNLGVCDLTQGKPEKALEDQWGIGEM
jgi:hypothetical protein